MLDQIILYSIRNKIIIGALVGLLVIAGLYQLTRLPIDAVPDITNNQVQVITVSPSFGAADIERLITFPVEQAVRNIAGIVEIRSFSRFGLSLVTVVFEETTDVYWARQQVSERLTQARAVIPPGMGDPELGPVSTGLGEIYQYVVRPKEGFEKIYDLTELRTVQDWLIKRQLLGVPGVADVSSFGGALKQYQVEVDPSMLQSYGLSISDLIKALENNNGNTGGSFIERSGTAISITTEGLLVSPEDIGAIALRQGLDGTPLLIRDVARVTIGTATRFGALCYNDQGEVAGGIVMMLKGANSSTVIRSVKERIAGIQSTLPPGIVIEPFLDRTKMVNNAISTVEVNLMEGALIVVFVLVLFLGNFRAGLLVASVIPLSMLFAVIMMNVFGVSGNLMSLGALDFGLIVDGAVIIVEAVMHRLVVAVSQTNRLPEKKEMQQLVAQSAGRMMKSAVFGQLVILVVYLPIFALQGIEGKMFKPMAQTVAFALVGAFLLSVTYVPMMSALLLRRRAGRFDKWSERLMHKLEAVFSRLQTKVLAFPKSALISVLVLAGLAAVILTKLGGEFIPTLEEGDFAVEARVLAGSNLNTTIKTTQQAAGILKSRFPEVEKVVTKIGSGEIPTDPMPMEASDMMVILKDKKLWTSASGFGELAEKMGNALSEVPGLACSFQFPVQMRFNELMTGAKQDVVCKIFGEDLDTLAKYAGIMGSLVSGINGARDLYVETVTGIPQVVIRYKRELMGLNGVSVADLNQTISAALAGKKCGVVFEGERRFDLVVRFESSGRTDLSDISNLPVPVSDGRQVPLSYLADVSVVNGPNQIQREDARRRISVGFNVRGRDVQSIVEELGEKVAADVRFPPGYYVVYGGSFENLNAARRRLSVAVPLALALIFLLLYLAFDSVRHALLIYSAIPLSAIGGIFALQLRGMPFSISAGIGFIALFGVAVLNGIVLISVFNDLRRQGLQDLREVVVAGTRSRLRPVLMTAAVASLGFLPMALSNGAGAEVQRPLATVVIGGLLVATFLTLFILPLLYIFFEKNKINRMNPKVTSLIIALLFALPSGHAQIAISLQAALDSAAKNNLAVKGQKLYVKSRNQLVKSSRNFPNTMVTAEYGQINSSYGDNRFSISQTFDFPLVYSRSRHALEALAGEAEAEAQMGEAELKKAVTLVFLELQHLQQKKILLMQSDSLYSGFRTAAQLRFDAGESNRLELATARHASGQVRLQLSELEADLKIRFFEFQQLLNSKAELMPEGEFGMLPSPRFTGETQVLQHPFAQVMAQRRQSADMQLAFQRSLILPSLFLAYGNMSMRGTGADNIFYDRSTRFQSIQLGVGLPIFFGAQRARINSARTGKLMAENDFHQIVSELDRSFRSEVQRLVQLRENLKYYQEEAYPNAMLMISLASQQFSEGLINYQEWVIANTQALNIRSEYLNALLRYNQCVTLINFMTSK